MKELKYWKQIFEEKGIKCTNQRLAILQALNNSQYPLSAQEIYQKLRKDNPKLRLSTVYRNLNFFEKENITRKLSIDDKENRFELVIGGHHHHLLCMKCGKITPIDCPLKNYQEKIQSETDYTIVKHRLKVYGICPECKD